MFPWPMIVAPVHAGLAIFAFTRRPLSLLIVALAPLMMLGNFIGQRTQQGKKLRLEIETFETQVEELEEQLAARRVVERERRHAEAPAVATVYEQAMRLGPMLWTRRPEHWNFLALRLGVGRARSRNTDPGVERPARHRPVRAAGRHAARRATSTIDDVPVIEMLPSVGRDRHRRAAAPRRRRGARPRRAAVRAARAERDRHRRDRRPRLGEASSSG